MENILTIFEKTAALHPEKTAVAFREESLTFRELKKEAGRYAAALGDVGQNHPVGVFANRTLWPAVWFLGVLYSHNFYVPIDPEMPAAKMQMLFDDAGFGAVIGGAQNRDKLAEIRYDGVFLTPDDLTENVKYDLLAAGTDPAYMVYTSGSTGKPKGVLKSHGAVVSFLHTYCDTFGFTGEEIIGNQTPFYFDAAAKDFYLMLQTGAAIEIIPTELFSMTTDLIEYMNQKKISFCSWVPTALSLVAQLCPFSIVKPAYLKRMFFIGEAMPVKHLNKWREALPEVEYVNLYGQSEIAGVCCYYRVAGKFDSTDTLPMGKPLGHCKVYLLENDEVIRQPGRIGELYIVSDALALEYYHDKEKTEASFLVKDFGEGPARCFRTGDLAQYNENGDLVFASRTDFQIKHMGRRIELGEIETIAGALPEIGSCCCLYDSRHKKIVLFCQLPEGVEMTGKQIQGRLKGKLTEYMMPKKVVVLEQLPLNANGKLDRQALKTML